jgi:intergrase/recombinase
MSLTLADANRIVEGAVAKAKEMNIKEKSEWKRVTMEDIKRFGGGHLVQDHYNNSLRTAINAIHSDSLISHKQMSVCIRFLERAIM